MTGNPHLTHRWPFGRVAEGLPTIQALYEIMESRSSDMALRRGFRALSLSTVSGSTSRPLRPYLRSTISSTRPGHSRTGYASSGEERNRGLVGSSPSLPNYLGHTNR
jgi:hypothetical protein